MKMHLSDKEAAVVLAALRLAQDTPGFDGMPQLVEPGMEQPSSEDIDQLCEKINCDAAIQRPGAPRITVEISGGLIQCVCTDGDAHILIVDYDSMKQDDDYEPDIYEPGCSQPTCVEHVKKLYDQYVDIDYSQCSDMEYDAIFTSLVANLDADALLKIEGAREVLREELNNKVLDVWARRRRGERV